MPRGPQHEATDAEMRGRGLSSDFTLPTSEQGYENPGPTKNLRGVEENTNRSKGTAAPVQPGTIGKEWNDFESIPDSSGDFSFGDDPGPRNPGRIKGSVVGRQRGTTGDPWNKS